MMLGGLEDPVVRFYRIEYAKEFSYLPPHERDLTPNMVRSRLGLPMQDGFLERVVQKAAKMLHLSSH